MQYGFDKTQLKYPEVYYSFEVKDILQSIPPVLRAKPSSPISPQKPQYLSEEEFRFPIWPYFLYCFPIALLIGLFFPPIKGAEMVVASIVIILFVILPICLIITAGIVSTKKSRKRKLTEYEKTIEHYERMEKQYLEDVKTLPLRLQQYEKAQEDKEYRDSLLLQYRIDRITSRKQLFFNKKTDMTIKKGAAESRLFKKLLDLYPNDCFDNSEIIIESDPSSSAPFFSYYPDIAIVIKGLYIDIEIDEPYCVENGVIKPIHYLKDSPYDQKSIDYERNRILSIAGWEIIRFTEEQVVLHPDECVFFIKAFIRSIMERNFEYHWGERGNIYYKEDLSDQVLDLIYPWRQEKWTYQEALKLAEMGYRGSYLRIT